MVEQKNTKKEEKKEAPKEESKKEEKKEVKVPKKFADLVEKIENLSVLELSELVKVLEEKFGVSATAPVAVTTTPGVGGGSGEEENEEKSEYAIHLKGVGDKKIEVIKAVRTITEQGLKEAKDMVDAVAEGPQVIKEGVPAEDAKKAEQLLKDAGAVVELK
ncbi:MAG: 50S ribosomal protein L7/L12 [Patescibacteria group bacterium]|nr:50S ribosomal protein L7/L12 [Patescibacteria group bacterium]